MDKSIEKILNRLPVTVKSFYIDNIQKNITEIRIRAGFDIKVCVDGDYKIIDKSVIDEHQLFELFYSLCEKTVSAYENQISNGYITLEGGHRVGIGGLFVKDTYGRQVIQKVTSLNIRLANYRMWKIPFDISTLEKGLLIAGGPHSGKTTFIRTICHDVTDKIIVVCDERNELLSEEINQDYIANIPKEKAIEQAVRTMNPDIIICDEIGNEEETKAILSAVNNGAVFICTVHAFDYNSLLNKPNVAKLLNSDVFDKIVFLENSKDKFSVKEIINV